MAVGFLDDSADAIKDKRAQTNKKEVAASVLTGMPCANTGADTLKNIMLIARYLNIFFI